MTRFRSRTVLISAAVALLALLVPACSAPAPDRTPAGSAQVWRSDGYGWIYSVQGDRLQIYETT
jgi:hypothetical protein